MLCLGEDEDAEGDRAFNNKPVFNRIAVVAGGPLFNFLLAFFAVPCDRRLRRWFL